MRSRKTSRTIYGPTGCLIENKSKVFQSFGKCRTLGIAVRLPDLACSGFQTEAFLTSLRSIRQFDLRTADDNKASLKKSRRHGLRRPTSAMTTAILGAYLAASTIRAQQSNPSGERPPTQSVSPKIAAADKSAHYPTDDLVYGMAVTRGAALLTTQRLGLPPL